MRQYETATKQVQNSNRRVGKILEPVQTDNWFTGTGKIVYDPVRPGLKTKNQWWCILEVDKGITEYYRWWVNKMVLNPLGLPKQDLCMPSWGPHMSIIRGEKPRPDKMHLWRKHEGRKVEFKYSFIPRQSGDTTGDRPDFYWFVDAVCPAAKELRDEFGIPSHWKFHITVGRSY